VSSVQRFVVTVWLAVFVFALIHPAHACDPGAGAKTQAEMGKHVLTTGFDKQGLGGMGFGNPAAMGGFSKPMNMGMGMGMPMGGFYKPMNISMGMGMPMSGFYKSTNMGMGMAMGGFYKPMNLNMGMTCRWASTSRWAWEAASSSPGADSAADEPVWPSRDARSIAPHQGEDPVAVRRRREAGAKDSFLETAGLLVFTHPRGWCCSHSQETATHQPPEEPRRQVLCFKLGAGNDKGFPNLATLQAKGHGWLNEASGPFRNCPVYSTTSREHAFTTPVDLIDAEADFLLSNRDANLVLAPTPNPDPQGNVLCGWQLPTTCSLLSK
jgi:hypothetical protein